MMRDNVGDILEAIGKAIDRDVAWVAINQDFHVMQVEDFKPEFTFKTKHEAVEHMKAGKRFGIAQPFLLASLLNFTASQIQGDSDPGKSSTLPEEIQFSLGTLESFHPNYSSRLNNIEELQAQLDPWGLNTDDAKWNLRYSIRYNLPEFEFTHFLKVDSEPIGVGPKFISTGGNTDSEELPIYKLDGMAISIINIPNITVDNINTKELEARMKRIDWDIDNSNQLPGERAAIDKIWKDYWKLWDSSMCDDAIIRLYLKYWKDTKLDEAEPKPGLFRDDFQNSFVLAPTDSHVIKLADQRQFSTENLRSLESKWKREKNEMRERNIINEELPHMKVRRK